MKKYASPNSFKSLINIIQRELAVVKELEERVTSLENELHPPVIVEVAPDGAASNWNYTLDDTNNTITLNYYTGSETDVTVYGRYQISGKTYDTKIGNGNASYSTPYMFNGNATTNCKNIQTITFKEGIDTSNVTNMSNMFYKCSALTQINGLENLDTSNVTDMDDMFEYCTSLTSLDLSNWDTSKVTTMTDMFNSCTSLTKIIGLENFDVSNVTDMTNIFYKCLCFNDIKDIILKWNIDKEHLVADENLAMLLGCNCDDFAEED